VLFDEIWDFMIWRMNNLFQGNLAAMCVKKEFLFFVGQSFLIAQSIVFQYGK